MRRELFGVLTVLLLRPGIARADVENFVVWQPEPAGVRYIIPKVRGQEPWQTAALWQAKMKSSQTYGKMENAQLVNLSTDPSLFHALPSSTEEAPVVAVVLNRPNQMTNKSQYLKTAISAFEKHGSNLYAIPVGLETMLKPKEMEQVYTILNTFDGQLGVGGDDAHPRTWGQFDVTRTEGDISWRRDIAQSTYLRRYLDRGRGRVFYICGSMQRAAVAVGFNMHDDIGELTMTPQRKSGAPVILEVVVEPESEIAKAAGKHRFETSNYHHAAVNPQARRFVSHDVKVTGYNIESDGTRGQIVKSLEFGKNAGFATQFHPEFEGSDAEKRIVQYVAAGWSMRGRYAPEKVVECLEKRLRSLRPN